MSAVGNAPTVPERRRRVETRRFDHRRKLLGDALATLLKSETTVSVFSSCRSKGAGSAYRIAARTYSAWITIDGLAPAVLDSELSTSAALASTS